jgi:hypothetical protein
MGKTVVSRQSSVISKVQRTQVSQTFNFQLGTINFRKHYNPKPEQSSKYRNEQRNL